MYDHFKQTGFMQDKIIVPFNEAMCYGKASYFIFSDKFILTRSKTLKVTREEYIEITLKPIQPLLNGPFSNITLWFDEDMFCQINLLTILAWLDQTTYHNQVILNIVDDQLQVISEKIIKTEGYKTLYNTVLIDKVMPEDVELASLKEGINLYLNYLHEDSDLMKFINGNLHLSENELVSLLLERFPQYGLGDLQYIELINERRKFSS